MAKLDRIKAKRMYCEDGLEIPEIAKRTGIPDSTLYRWKNDALAEGDDWDGERVSLNMTSFSAYKQTLKIAIDQITAFANGKPMDSKSADAVTKIVKAVKSLYKDVDMLGNVLLAMAEFTEFLAERDPELLEKLHPYLVEFGEEMNRKFGKKSGQ